MRYVIAYDRKELKTVTFEEYGDADLSSTRIRRLALELEARHADKDIEVVILRASNRKSLEKTHARYFEKSLESLLRKCTKVHLPEYF